MKHIIYIASGPQQGKQFLLRPGSNSIGRERSNEIAIRDEEVSRRHAEIHLTSNRVTISDSASANGTYVNQAVVKSADIKNSDEIRVGKTTLLLIVSPSTDEMPSLVTQPATKVENAVDFSDPLSITDSLTKDGVETVQSNLQFLYDAALATSKSGESRAMCLRLLSLIFDWIAADRGCILLRDEVEGGLTPQAVKYRSRHARRHKLTVSQTIVNYVMQKGNGVLTQDALADKRWSSEGSILTEGVKEVICVPIRGRSKLYGVIYVDRSSSSEESAIDRQSFNTDQLKLIIAIGHQAAVAIESENYYSEIVKSERHTAIGQTLSALSHHIKNILQSINGGAHLVEKGVEKSNFELVQSGWQIVRGNQKRISNLMLDMLNYSKQHTPVRKWCEIDEVIAAAIQAQIELAQRQGVDLIANVVKENRAVMLDPVSMETAIANVFVHSLPILKTIEGGVITVEASFTDHELNIRFEDNYQTATDAQLEQIFSPFAVENEHEVRGISLAVSDKIVREHDGFMNVYRNQTGLTVEITLPLVGQKKDSPTIVS